jgi:endonuclease/exonuclease/phosphatase family metal-dependent hydrolase
MIIACYNLSNLFEPAKVFKLPGLCPEAKAIIADYYKLIQLIAKPTHFATGQSTIASIIKTPVESLKYKNFILINEIKGKLYSYNASTKKVTIKATGRGDWIGWPELIKKEVDKSATQKTALIAKAVKADILRMIGVDNQVAHKHFNRYMLGNYYKCNMLIDGNDKRGIDVGINSNHEITSISTHIFDLFTGDNGKEYRIFGRDCPVYTIKYKTYTIYFLCNHFKSRGYGNQADNNKKRQRQAKQVKAILSAFNLSTNYVVVVGDLNNTPDSAPLHSVLSIPDLHNITKEKLPPKDHGTYLNKKDQINYLLVSSASMANFVKAGINRKVIYRKNATDRLPGVKSEITQASDRCSVSLIQFLT